MNDERAVGAARPAMSPPEIEDMYEEYDGAEVHIQGDIVTVVKLNGVLSHEAGFILTDQDDDVLLAIATRCEFIVQSRNEEVEDERNEQD